MDSDSIAKRWRELSGLNEWKGLLDPLDMDLRRYLIHYGEMAQATYDNFNDERASRYTGAPYYSKKNMFSKVYLEVQNPYKYKPTKYLYATSSVELPESFIVTSFSKHAVLKDTNWIGYVAVATDEGKSVLGRRDIVVAWRGTVRPFEWAVDFNAPLVPATPIFPSATGALMHRGWLSIYTSENPRSPYSKTSARKQVLEEVKRLVEKYKHEDISITVTGHSLAASIATLSAADIAANLLGNENTGRHCPVTAFSYACPRIGDIHLKAYVESIKDLHILRMANFHDIVPHYPTIELGYADIGNELKFNSEKSKYLKVQGDFSRWHDLEVYLHVIAGTHGENQDFHLVIKRDIALVNKMTDPLKEEYLIPQKWRQLKNKGMVQKNDGSWKLEDHETDDEEH